MYSNPLEFVRRWFVALLLCVDLLCLISSYVDDNKREIVKEGAVPIFIDLLKSNDVKLQNEAVGALRNLSVDGVLYKSERYEVLTRNRGE